MEGGAKKAVELLQSWVHPQNIADGLFDEFERDVSLVCKEINFLQSQVETLEKTVKFQKENGAHKTESSDDMQDVITGHVRDIRTLERNIRSLEEKIEELEANGAM